MKQIIILISILLFSTCEKETSQKDVPEKAGEEVTSKVSRVTKKEVEAIKFLDYGLNRPTEKAVENWDSYTELETLITSIKNGDLSYFEGDEKIMAAFIQDLKTTIPESVLSPSIIARITALETKFYKLKSSVKITKTPKTELISTIKEFLQACSNLNLQMNKKLEKEAQNIYKNNL